MEENQNQEQIPNSEDFNFFGNGKKKKGMGPVKGLFLAIIIVLLICIVGLLVRMVIAGDGDFFKPIKDIFGIEAEETDDKKASNKVEKDEEPVEEKSGRYTLLSDDVYGKGVKHYRMTIDVKDLVDKALNSDDLSGVFTQTTDLNLDDYENYFEGEARTYGGDSSYDMDGLEASMGMAQALLGQMMDVLDGEVYFDIYFKGNDIIQVVVGYDYYDMVEGLYDMFVDMGDETVESMKDEGVESAEDLAEYLKDTIAEEFNEEALYDSMMEDEDMASALKDVGFKEKDVDEAIDLVNETGILEFYINGTDKLQVLISAGLSSDEFQAQLDEIEDTEDYEFDEDNIIESMLLYANESDEYQDMGVEFVEVED